MSGLDKEHVRNILDSLHYEMRSACERANKKTSEGCGADLCRVKGVNPLVWELYFKLREELLEEPFKPINHVEEND
jgi:hypothetical protein